MPGFDKTGPLGQGVMTGRGLGPCVGGMGFGRGFGRGMGRSFERAAPVTMTKEEQKKILEEEKKFIEERLRAVDKKLKEMV